MKKIYQSHWTRDPNDSIEYLIKDCDVFDNFSTRNWNSLYMNGDCWDLYPSFENAWDDKPDNTYSLMIIEYILTEDQLFDKTLKINPNIRYFITDKLTNNLKEITIKSFA